MKRHINICIRIEETAGKIYRKMAESQCLCTKTRQALQELAKDEDEHANQLRFALRFPENSVVKSLPAMLKQSQQLLELAQRLLQKTDLNQVDDTRAIRIGIEMEKRFCQTHIANSFEFTDQKMKNMFAAMAKADELHCQQLYDMQKYLSQS